MGLFGGIGGLLGIGNTSQSVTDTNTNNVNVTVNPQIGIGIDTGPIADAVAKINADNADLVAKVAQGDHAAAEAIAQGLSNQATAFGALATQVQAGAQKLSGEMLAAGAALLIFFMWKGRAHG